MIGNVLVLIVILTSKSMRSSTNLFLLNLSLADLLVLIVCCPNAMIEMYMRTVRFYNVLILLQGSHFPPSLSLLEYLGDGKVYVPDGPLHRADGVPHLCAHYSRHHCRKVRSEVFTIHSPLRFVSFSGITQSVCPSERDSSGPRTKRGWCVLSRGSSRSS